MAGSYDLIVIGTGVAATTVAETCRKAGWQVAIVDRRPYGGTCMLRGCDPKKLLWGVAELVDQARRFAGDGVSAPGISLSWPDLMKFKKGFLQPLPQAVEQRLASEGIATLHGEAHFVDRAKIAVDGEVAEAKHIVIASGSKPRPLAISGAEHLLTSDDFLDLEEQPDSLIFVGGGYISFEFAHTAARAGVKVTILNDNDRPLGHFDRDLVRRLIDKTRHIGIDLELDSPVERIERSGGGVTVRAGHNRLFEAAAAVHGAGRVPDIDELDLAAGGVEREGHRLRLTPSLRSVSNPIVHAAGDAALAGPMLTPVSILDAEVVAGNLLEGGDRSPDYKGIPSVVFTIPALASVGLSEEQARRDNLAFRVEQADTSGWYAARRLKEDTAAFKVLIEEKTDRLLGAHVIGPNAEEVINLFALAIRLDITSDRLREFVPAYPSQGANVGYMLG